MGRNLTIYFKDDILDLFEAEPNKSKLINDLLRDYYSTTEEQINLNLEKSEKKVAVLKQNLLDKKRDRVKVVRQKEGDAQEEKDKAERIELIEKFNLLKNGEKVSEADYWDAYNEETRSFDMDKVEAIITKLEESKK